MIPKNITEENISMGQKLFVKLIIHIPLIVFAAFCFMIVLSHISYMHMNSPEYVSDLFNRYERDGGEPAQGSGVSMVLMSVVGIFGVSLTHAVVSSLGLFFVTFPKSIIKLHLILLTLFIMGLYGLYFYSVHFS